MLSPRLGMLSPHDPGFASRQPTMVGHEEPEDHTIRVRPPSDRSPPRSPVRTPAFTPSYDDPDRRPTRTPSRIPRYDDTGRPEVVRVGSPHRPRTPAYGPDYEDPDRPRVVRVGSPRPSRAPSHVTRYDDADRPQVIRTGSPRPSVTPLPVPGPAGRPYSPTIIHVPTGERSRMPSGGMFVSLGALMGFLT